MSKKKEAPKERGSNLTPKSLWRDKRDISHRSWLRQLDAYIRKVSPPVKRK